MEEDPLTLAMSPPPNETPEERQAREVREAEAQRISDEIDEQIRKEKEAKRKKKRPVKVLLLGQSESGACSQRFSPRDHRLTRHIASRKDGDIKE